MREIKGSLVSIVVRITGDNAYFVRNLHRVNIKYLH
jgi:spore coat polysaccharide biosynthesis protein SpsF (cytidylyltransferase family)